MVSRGWSPGRNLGGKAGGVWWKVSLFNSGVYYRSPQEARYQGVELSTRPVFLQFEKDREENI